MRAKLREFLRKLLGKRKPTLKKDPNQFYRPVEPPAPTKKK